MNPIQGKRGEEQPVSTRDRETRQQILKAAEELFLDKGYSGVSMKDVAEAVQVTSAALYYHFPAGKQDLFMSMIHSLFEGWNRGALLAVAPVQGVRERLLALTQYMFTLPFDRLALLARDVHEQIADKGKRRMVMLQTRDALLQHVSTIFQEAIDTGEIKATIPANVLATMFEGMSASVLRGKHLAVGGIEQFDTSQLATLIVSALLDGIAQ